MAGRSERTDERNCLQQRYFNRELSWLAFNRRVLSEALNPAVPLLERCKFLAIVTSNLDEFFMVRVAGLKEQLAAGITSPDPSGLGPAEQLREISGICHDMIEQQYRCLNEEILPALAREGIEIIPAERLTPEQRRHATRYFQEVLFPILTPMAIDPGHPFPTLVNNALYVAVRMDSSQTQAIRGANLAVMQIPAVVPRFVEFRDGERVQLLPLEGLIEMHLSSLFAGHKVTGVHPFRLTRDSDLDLDEEASEDLLTSIEEQLRLLRRGSAVRLNVTADMDAELLAQLRSDLRLEEEDIYSVPGLMELKRLWQLHGLKGFDRLRDPAWPPVRTPALRGRRGIFAAVRQADIFLHHPYYSFDPVVEFMQEAADDPNVLAIKQTLYRTSGESPVVRALERAARNGKHVTVLVELKARFDEERNIQWARQLEQAGADVIYGLVGLKTHCKALLVVRREASGVRRYVHLATGNYNDATARVYTDIGILSARPELAEDVSALFNVITGYSVPPRWNLVEIAPTGLRRFFLHLIRREQELHSSATPGRIRAKVNSLVDTDVIDALYAASQAGVEIELLVRGICCLRPGVPGLSGNIRVRSVVDRFLEHSRIFHFHAGGREEVYIGSADWMPRNLDRRIELVLPVLDPAAREEVLAVLNAGLADTVKSWELHPDGRYERYTDGQPAFHSQERLYQRAVRAAEEAQERPSRRATFQRRSGPREL